MLYVKKLDVRATIPTVAHPGDLGYDLYALEDTLLAIGGVTKIRTGIVACYGSRYFDQHAKEYGLLIRDRSSMAAAGVFVVGGVLDAGYRGEIIVMLSSSGQYDIKAKTKIAQAIPVEVMTGAGVTEVDILTPSERGESGFGSSGQ